MGDCTAVKSGIDDTNGELICDLAAGHDGLHWDSVDDISWKVGKPDE